MFTRFAAARRSPYPQLAGALVSVTTHALLLTAALGGGRPSAGAAPAEAAPVAAPRAPVGERIRWVGLRPTGGTDGTSGGMAPPPVAYVIPGRGPMREGAPPDGRRSTRRRGAPSPASAPSALPAPVDPTPGAAPPARPARGRLDRGRLALALPVVPETDATLLIAGVVASAPDLSRLPSSAERFAPLPLAELTADVGVGTTTSLRALAHVDVLPIAMVTNPVPAYPAGLARARVGGRVVVEFTIDSAGVVAAGSLRVVESTDVRFTEAVHAVVPQLRFVPARLDRQAVGLTVRQPFLFVVRPGS